MDVFSLFAVLLLPLISSADSSCDDIDPKACVLMNSQRQDFCKDAVLAPTACPRFCNLCPIKCYHCNTTVTDFHKCNTLTQCGPGELCMRKQLNSIMDGHHEYLLTCEKKQTCDGLGLTIPFVGKRGFESRDISISCCESDGCNYPTYTTQTSTPASTQPSSVCRNDVLLIVDETRSLSGHFEQAIDSFLTNVFSDVPVGPDDVLVSLATFSMSTTKRWGFNDHTTSSSLQHALSHLSLDGGNGDLNTAISYAVNNVNSHVDGNRLDAPDVVLILTDGTAKDQFREMMLDSQLHHRADNVIAVGIGEKATSNVQHIASDGHHVFHVATPHDLNSIYLSVARLICETI